MLPKTHGLSFSFVDVGGGDAIWIRFLGNDQQWHNILIDGGYAKTYRDVFGPLIGGIVKKECIDLWIISHIDNDHIGAVQGFMQDKKIKDKKTAVQQFWFNHSPLSINWGTGKLGVGQGVKFREFLKGQGLLIKEGITTQLPEADFWGMKIRILSPNPEMAKNADEHWQAIEHGGKLGRSAEDADHKKKFEELISTDFLEDDDIWNGSSIAILLEFKGIKVLLLADSHPSVVAESLRTLGISADSPLDAAFVQLSHHGSKRNTSIELLKLINTGTFVVTGNGITNRHPDKETLVRVLTRKGRPVGPLEFVFPSDTEALRAMFAVDEDAFRRYNFRCAFPGKGDPQTSLEFLPIKEPKDE